MPERRSKRLVAHFDDLTRAHDAVVRAKAQLDLLAPFVAELDTHRSSARGWRNSARQRAALPCLPRSAKARAAARPASDAG